MWNVNISCRKGVTQRRLKAKQWIGVLMGSIIWCNDFSQVVHEMFFGKFMERPQGKSCVDFGIPKQNQNRRKSLQGRYQSQFLTWKDGGKTLEYRERTECETSSFPKAEPDLRNFTDAIPQEWIKLIMICSI